MKKVLLFTGLTLFLAACAAQLIPFAGIQGTPTPYPSKTPHPTLTPYPIASITPGSTRTPAATLSATSKPVLSLTPPVRISSSPPTPTVSHELECMLLWRSPGRGIIYKPDQGFTVGWKIKNIGTAQWDADKVEFTYVAGAKLYDYPLVHLETSVDPGKAVILSVHMRAPTRNAMVYTTIWSLRQGDTYFCRLMLSIYVK